MSKGQDKSSKPQYLPSLLDRVSDDDYINKTLQLSRNNILSLEKKLAAKDTEESESKKILEELKTHRGQLAYLQSTIGSHSKISDCVKRDLTWLFNCNNLCEDALLEEKYPEIQSSVINYGLPDLTGKTASSVDVYELQEIIRETILRFEPRIISKTLDVVLHEDKESMDHNSLVFEISGEIWTDPIPVHLHLKTQMDLESGTVEVKDI